MGHIKFHILRRVWGSRAEDELSITVAVWCNRRCWPIRSGQIQSLKRRIPSTAQLSVRDDGLVLTVGISLSDPVPIIEWLSATGSNDGFAGCSMRIFRIFKSTIENPTDW